MSFSSDTKNELARVMPEKKEAMLAEIAALLRLRGEYVEGPDGRWTIVLSTESPAIARHVTTLIREYFRVDTALEIEERQGRKKGHHYIVTIGPEPLAEQILRETGILMVREGRNHIEEGIFDGLLRTKAARKAYLRGLFLTGGTMSAPDKEYHYEISCGSRILAGDVRRLLNSFEDIGAKTFRRKREEVVYVKEAGQILDLLAIMGAHSQYFAFEEIRFRKELKAQANRLANCDQANIDKSLAAANASIAAIHSVGLENLPPKLAETARVRIEHPEASLKELGEMMDPPLSKAGVNGRLRRIAEMAAREK